MGWGLYDMLGWGVLDPPWPDEAMECDIMFAIQDELGLKGAYETEPTYLVVPLAGDDGYPRQERHLPPLPAWVGRVGTRQARYLTPTATQVRQALAARGIDVPARWAQAQAVYRKAGLVLPMGALILLNDYD